jgi:hypothetical protein
MDYIIKSVIGPGQQYKILSDVLLQYLLNRLLCMNPVLSTQEIQMSANKFLCS